LCKKNSSAAGQIFLLTGATLLKGVPAQIKAGEGKTSIRNVLNRDVYFELREGPPPNLFGTVASFLRKFKVISQRFPPFLWPVVVLLEKMLASHPSAHKTCAKTHLGSVVR